MLLSFRHMVGDQLAVYGKTNFEVRQRASEEESLLNEVENNHDSGGLKGLLASAKNIKRINEMRIQVLLGIQRSRDL